MSRELIVVIEQIGREKGIDKEILFDALESALLAVWKKKHPAAENARIAIDRKTGERRLYYRKTVVDAVTDAELEIGLANAKALNPDAEVGVELELEDDAPPQDFGRIDAQTVRQVIMQKVRDAEREGIYSEFANKEGQIVRGVVHRIEKRNVILEIGKAEAILPEREQIPGERYNPGDRVRAFVLEVRRATKGPQITLSRTHPGYLVRLFETEIPEIQEGIVLVKAAAREPGERAKVAVASTKRDVDPIGACVGLRGTRIQVISRELRSEKIDIIEWSSDPVTFVARALSPAKVSSVEVAEEPPVEEGAEAPPMPMQPSALVIVPDNQLSLAIGKKGQNARLAAKLTGMRIDIKSESEVAAEEAGPDDGGIAGLVALGSVTPAQVMALQAAGLHSVDGLVAAGAERLREIAEVGGDADALLAAAERWLAARDREPEEAPQAAADEARDDVAPADGLAPGASSSGETPAA